MAYPTISAPYGLKPVNLQGGRVFSGSTRMIPIPMGASNSFYNGDVVGIANGALTTLSANYVAGGTWSSSAGGALGVFVGAEYTNSSNTGVPIGPIYGKNRYQFWAGGTNANDAVGYVVDDPLAYFRVAVLAQPQAGVSNTAATTIGYMSESFVGSNAYIVSASVAGSAATGDSGFGVSGANPSVSSSIAGNNKLTGSAALRVVQLVPDTAVTAVGTVNTAVTSATASTVVLNSVTGIYPGMQIWFPNYSLPGTRQGDYSYVTGVVTSTNTVTFTAPAGLGAGSTIVANATNITVGSTVAFVGYPEVIVGWTAGTHTYNVTGGV